eukprot:14139696-Alexandrium_andersonii.AAC.2
MQNPLGAPQRPPPMTGVSTPTSAPNSSVASPCMEQRTHELFTLRSSSKPHTATSEHEGPAVAGARARHSGASHKRVHVLTTSRRS